MRTLAILLALTSFMACDPFRKAERRIDRPNGKVEDDAAVQSSVQRGSLQANSSDIISNTTDSLALPFENFAPRTDLDRMLALPDVQQKFPMARAISNMTRLALANSPTPYALQVESAGILDASVETGGVCSGTIDFEVLVDLDVIGESVVEVQMGFNAVTCPEGSIDGSVAFQASFDALANSLKIINIIEATVSDNVTTETIDFAFRLDGDLLTATLALDMSVVVNEDFLTLSIDGSLATGTATLTVVGRDETATCTLSNFSATCEGPNGSFTFQIE